MLLSDGFHFLTGQAAKGRLFLLIAQRYYSLTKIGSAVRSIAFIGEITLLIVTRVKTAQVRQFFSTFNVLLPVKAR